MKLPLVSVGLFLSGIALGSIYEMDDEDALLEALDEGVTIEFKIPKGTTNKPWNTRDRFVSVKVGDTLRLVNDDTVDHHLHTNGRPCPHGTKAFKPGETYDCVISKPADPDKDILYDHQHGPTSRFYVQAKE